MGSTAKILRAGAAAQPLIVDGVVIPPPAHRVRAMMEENRTPINGENVRWVNDGKNTDPDASGQPHWLRQNDCYAFADSCGLEHYQIAGPGQLNRHVWWVDCKDLADFAVNGMKIPDNVTQYDPPTEPACRAIGSLSGDPKRFEGKAAKFCPIMVDLEVGSTLTNGSDTAAQRKVKILHALDTYRWLREGAGGDVTTQQIFEYGWSQYRDVPYVGGPDAETDALMDEWRAAVTPCSFFYWAEELCVSATRYRDECEAMIADLLARYPGRECVVVLSPTIALNNPAAHPDIAHLDGAPVPFDQFSFVTRRCAEAGISLALWTGNARVDGVRPHIAVVAVHGTNPAGAAAHYHPNP